MPRHQKRGQDLSSRAVWPQHLAAVMAFAYAPERWAWVHHFRWIPSLERRRRKLLGWLYQLAGAYMLGLDDQLRPGPALKPVYLRYSAPLQGRLDDGDQRERGTLGDRLRATLAGGGGTIIDTGNILVTPQPWGHLLAQPDDPPSVQQALRKLEPGLRVVMTSTWKICPLCARIFPARRNTWTCPPCRRRLKPRQIEWRLAHAPRIPVALKLSMRFPLVTSTRTIHRPEGSWIETTFVEHIPILALDSRVGAPPALRRMARLAPLNSTQATTTARTSRGLFRRPAVRQTKKITRRLLTPVSS
jgi:hypothetical protein